MDKSKAKERAAAARAGAENEQNPDGAAGTNRASQAGNSAGKGGTNIAQEMGKKLGDQMTGQIMYHAMKTVDSNLSSGNYGEIFEQFMDSFQDGFNATLERNNLSIREDLDPKYALPSSEILSNSASNSPTNSSKATALVTWEAEVSD